MTQNTQIEAKALADRLAGLHMNSCTCPQLTSKHPPECPTAIIDDCCAFLRREAAAPSEEPVAQWQIWVEDGIGPDGWVNEDAEMIEHWRSKGRKVRALFASPAVAPVVVSVKGLEELIRWAHDTLYEIGSPRDYLDLREVAKLNEASVEVILGLAQYLGEKHGHSEAWWAEYRSKHPDCARILSSIIPATKGGEDKMKSIRELVDLVAAEMMGESTTEDGDDEPVGWTTDGPLPMTFGHIRRAQKALAALAQDTAATPPSDTEEKAL